MPVACGASADHNDYGSTVVEVVEVVVAEAMTVVISISFLLPRRNNRLLPPGAH